MNVLEKIYVNSGCIQVSKEQKLSLPVEIFIKVLSYLGAMDLEQTSLVSHHWNVISIDAAWQIVKEFLNPLKIDTLKLNVDILVGVKCSLHTIKEKVLNILKNEDLSRFKTKRRSLFFENVIDLAKIYKKIDKANKMAEGDQRWNALSSSCEKLLDKNCFKKAIEVAHMILNENKKETALTHITLALGRKEDIDNGLEVANMISDEDQRFKALNEMFLSFRGNHFYFSGPLEQSRDLDERIEIAKMIPFEIEKGDALQDLSEQLFQRGNSAKAIRVLNMIPNETQRKEAFQDLYKTFMQSSTEKFIAFVKSLLGY